MSRDGFCRGCHNARLHIASAEGEIRRIAQLMASSERNAMRYRDRLAAKKALLIQLRADKQTHEVACALFLAVPALVRSKP